jgi:hypothetical protein
MTHTRIAKAIVARFDRGEQVFDKHARMIVDVRLARKHKITMSFSSGLLSPLDKAIRNAA